MPTTAHSLEDRIRRMTPVAAPPEQQAQVAALSRAMEGMVQAPKRRPPKCQLVGPNGEARAAPLPETWPLRGKPFIRPCSMPRKPCRSNTGAISPRWADSREEKLCIVRSELKLIQSHQPLGKLSSRVHPCPRSGSICAKSQVTSRFSVDGSPAAGCEGRCAS